MLLEIGTEEAVCMSMSWDTTQKYVLRKKGYCEKLAGRFSKGFC